MANPALIALLPVMTDAVPVCRIHKATHIFQEVVVWGGESG